MRKVGTKLIILVRFDVSLHKPIASMLDLLYLCKIKRVGQRVGYLQKDRCDDAPIMRP